MAEELFDDRIWIDGCFDFAHHGHAGVMLQARRLGASLHVGIHSDESILENKGPTVMNLEERCTAVDACRWVTKSVKNAPYVTLLPFISQFGCRYVVHGDDVTSDSGGEDCYRYVKQAGRFKVVKRTPGISTTDLVGRMLLCTKAHFINNLADVLDGNEGHDESQPIDQTMRQRITDYATDETGHLPHVPVWSWNEASGLSQMVHGIEPQPRQRIVYADGGFDLFTPGHIEFLNQVVRTEEAHARDEGWYLDEQREQRIKETRGSDYAPVYLIAGVHDDQVINQRKGVNYPIMNILERGLCVLQCKHVSALAFSAPFVPTEHFLNALPGTVHAVYQGPVDSTPSGGQDPYKDAKAMGIYRQISSHKYQNINAAEIVERIMKSRVRYEERQRIKGVKGIGEEAVRRRELMEREQAEKSIDRRSQP